MTRTLSNRYELGDVIGVGGSAEVFAAHDTLLDRQVAVKVLDGRAAESNDPSGRRRFLAEAQSSARFSHPHAVAVFDAGDSDGELFIVMEYVDGTSLAHVIADEAPLGEKEVVRITTQLLDALQAAHEAGLVHRDVKPANILITQQGDVKLADFGIAKRFDDLADGLTTAGMVIGTKRYLAPEQAAGNPATPQSDLYAVGLVAYEMLTGGEPDSMAAPNVRAQRPNVSPSISAAIGQALATDPADRPASAAAFAAGLVTGLAPTTISPATPVDAAHEPTSLMELAEDDADDAQSDATALMVPVPTIEPRPEPSGGGRWILVGAAVLLLLIAGIAFAQRGPSDFEQVLTDSTAAPAPADAEPTVEPTSPDFFTPEGDPDEATVVETEPTIEFAPPITDAAAAVPAEIMPGFPVPADFAQFIAQLSDGKDVVGKQSKKLGDELLKLVEHDAEDRPEQAEDFVEQLEEWVEKGEIDPRIAAVALDYLFNLI